MRLAALELPVASAGPSRRVLTALVVLVLAHVMLAWLTRIPEITWGEDDAVYSLLARALQSGSYREFWIIDEPIHARYPPGLPALLAVLNLFFGERLDVHLALMTLCSAASLLLMFDVARRHVGADVALFATGIMSLNPLWVSEAGLVMAEAPFRLFLMLTMWLVTDRPGGRDHWVLASASAVAAALIRTAGVAVIGALALHWMLRREWNRVFLLSVAALPAVGWLAWTTIAPNPDETGVYVHVVTVGDPRGRLTFAEQLAAGVWAYIRRAVPTGLSFFALKENPLDNILWAGLAAATIPIGLVVLWRRWRFLVLFLASYAAVLLAWPWRDARFVSPASGFVLVLVAVGTVALARALRQRHHVVVLAAVAVLFMVGAWQAGAPRVRAALACDRTNPWESESCAPEDQRGMGQLAGHVRTSTPPDAIFFAPKEGAFYYHTERRSIRDRRAVRTHPDSFVTHLRRSGASYAVLTPVGINWTGHNRQLGYSCGAFELVQSFIGDATLLRLESEEHAASDDSPACAVAGAWKDGAPARWRERHLQ
ncbi:MAG TPA: glycosyltransferase family 39 protein [Gemmatimonadaceae bacterium]|nr:glycosyltransferase family 39 protein [Gemmatimonadaceae bacterium]